MRESQMNSGIPAAKLLQRVNIYGFAVDEAVLYLDTHPDDCEARAFYQRMRDAYEEARREYVEGVGPLSADDVDVSSCWIWMKGPWPWEGGMC